MKKAVVLFLVIAIAISILIGCGSRETTNGETEIQVFVAASLSSAMEEIAAEYMKEHPEVNIFFNADGSGTLYNQIKEGYSCDIFFSADQKQMNMLEAEDLLVEDTRTDVVCNQVVLVTYKGSDTCVTGLENMGDASSIALADGSVPVGKYTRAALVSLGILDGIKNESDYTTAEVQTALGGALISEQSNAAKVLMAVAERSCEIGTIYFSDTYGHEDIEIIQKVSNELTGDIVYPISQVKNEEASEAEKQAAKDFIFFITSDKAKIIFNKYLFDAKVN